MFTGIIQEKGAIVALDKHGDWTATIKTTALPLSATAIGASIACSGVCLTVIEKSTDCFMVQISGETLSKTTAARWSVGTLLNLETALRVGDELGGHLVSGHVDGMARVVSRNDEGESVRFVFVVALAFAKFIASKGSVAIDGVSLTVNHVEGARFGVNIIPHTQHMTTMGALQAGDDVNFEIDTIARYVERMLNEKSL